jgi:hypothetical protein
MEEEDDDDEWRPQQFYPNVISRAYSRACGGEELGPLRAMTATGVGLSSSKKRTLESSLAIIFLRKRKRYLTTNCTVAGN